MPFEEVKAEIQQRLSAERAAREYEAYMEGLRKDAIIDVRVREVPLQATVPATPGLETRRAAPQAAPGRPRPRRGAPPSPRPATTPQAAPEHVVPEPCRRPRLRPGRPVLPSARRGSS